MKETLKTQNPELYEFITRILGMDFYRLCKESIVEDENDLYDVLFKWISLIDDTYTLGEDLTLELQLKLCYTTRFLSEAFRDDVEAELLNIENLPMVIKAASVFEEYENANGGDFFEFVCEFLEEEEELVTMVERMSEYFGLEHEEKCEDEYDWILCSLKENNEKYLSEKFFA